MLVLSCPEACADVTPACGGGMAAVDDDDLFWYENDGPAAPSGAFESARPSTNKDAAGVSRSTPRLRGDSGGTNALEVGF